MRRQTTVSLLAGLMFMAASCGSPGDPPVAAANCQVPYLLLTANSRQLDMLNPGAFIWQQDCSYTYNSDGYRITNSCQSDSTGDGLLNREIVKVYTIFNTQGNHESMAKTVDLGLDGIIDSSLTLTSSYTYDASGNILILDERIGVQHNTFTYTYNIDGFVLTQVAEFDYTNDGVIDDTWSETITYTAANLPATLTFWTPTGSSVTTPTYQTLDPNGLPTSLTSASHSYDALGVLIWSDYSARTLSYDANGNMLTEMSNSFSDAAMTIQTGGYENSSTWAACSAATTVAASTTSTNRIVTQQSKVKFNKSLLEASAKLRTK